MTSVLKDNNGKRKQLDSLIAILEKELIKARVERNNLQTIVCLAPEVLLEIFDWIIYSEPNEPDEPNEPVWAKHPCLQLSQVCQRWRELVLSTTRFWTILDNSSVPRGRSELLRLSLERAIEQPLSVRISTASQRSSDLHAFMKPIFDPGTIGRVKKLVVAFDHRKRARKRDEERLIKQMTMNRRKGLLKLAHLEISGGWFVFACKTVTSKEDDPPLTEPPISLAELHTLKVQVNLSIGEAMPLKNWSLPSTLVNLSLTWTDPWWPIRPAWTTVLDVLEPMTRLETLELSHAMESSFRALRTTTVEFCHLHSLTLVGPMQILGEFLEFLSLPALSHFSLTTTVPTTIKQVRDRMQRVAQGEFDRISQLVHGMQRFQQAKAAYFKPRAYRPGKPARYQLKTWNHFSDRPLLTDTSFKVTNLISSRPDVNIDFTLNDVVDMDSPEQQGGPDPYYNMFERNFPTLSDSELASKEVLILDCEDPIIPYTAALAMTGLQALFLGGTCKIEVFKTLFQYGRRVIGRRIFRNLRVIRFDRGLITADHVATIENVLKARQDAGLPRVCVLFVSCKFEHSPDTAGALSVKDVRQLKKYADVRERFDGSEGPEPWFCRNPRVFD